MDIHVKNQLKGKKQYYYYSMVFCTELERGRCLLQQSELFRVVTNI